MKFHKLDQIKKISIEQGFKLCSLENNTGVRLIPYNTGAKTSVGFSKHFDSIKKRLDSEICPDGVYCICVTNTPQRDPERFYYNKGNVNQEIIKPEIRTHKAEEVLSYSQALDYQNRIAQFEAREKYLNDTNKELKDYCDELEAEIEQLKSNPALSEAKETGMNKFLNEMAPTLPSILDRYFDLEEKKLNAKNNSTKHKSKITQVPKRTVRIGSQEHLKIIDNLFNTNDEDKFNIHLDKIEAYDKALYSQLCEKYNLTEEEEEQQEEEQEDKQ